MDYILDIIFAVVFVIFIITGYKKGFIKSLIELISHLVAVIGARIIAAVLAPQVYESFFEEGISTALGEKIASLGSDASAQIQSALESVPKLSGFLSVAGVDEAQITESISNQINSSGADITQALMTNLVSPVMTFIVRIFLFIIAFAVCLFAMKLLSRVLDKLSELPVLKQANRAFGLLFGALKGVIVIAVFCAVIQLITGLIGSEALGDLVSNSVVISAFNTLIGAVKI